MATTPEGRVKAEIDKVLKAAPECEFDKPVVSAYGNAMLDYVGCSRGRYFEIEAKAPGKKPTARQEHRMETRAASGRKMFFITGKPKQLDALREWLHSH